MLTVRLNGREICSIAEGAIPSEQRPSAFSEGGGVLEFLEGGSITHRHALGDRKGWYHFSVRVHANLACQADCAITDNQHYDPNELVHGNGSGIRFQPFFLAGAKVSDAELHGKGLFARGLHFPGNVTRGNILLSGECDACHRSFQIKSFHAGFSNCGYFYSASGRYTIIVSDRVPGCPAPLSKPDPAQLAALEQALPLAPDGTRYGYLNPFRCPYCAAPYIDFPAHPEIRPGEFYGNYFPGDEVISFRPESPHT
jgi:hypothetical protein